MVALRIGVAALSISGASAFRVMSDSEDHHLESASSTNSYPLDALTARAASLSQQRTTSTTWTLSQLEEAKARSDSRVSLVNGDGSCSEFLQQDGACALAVFTRVSRLQSRPGAEECTRAEIEANCPPGPLSCEAAMNAQFTVMRTLATADMSDAQIRGRMCGTWTSPSAWSFDINAAPPQCGDENRGGDDMVGVNAVLRACGGRDGCQTTALDACAEPFVEPTACSRFLQTDGACDLAVVTRTGRLQSRPGAEECTRAEIEAFCPPGPVSCEAAMNAQFTVMRTLATADMSDAQIRGRMCGTWTSPSAFSLDINDAPPQCGDAKRGDGDIDGVNAVIRACGGRDGCQTRALDACAEPFVEPTIGS